MIQKEGEGEEKNKRKEEEEEQETYKAKYQRKYSINLGEKHALIFIPIHQLCKGKNRN